MRSPRHPRRLTGEEARLWGEIAKLITPLRGRVRPSSPPADSGIAPATPRPEMPIARKAELFAAQEPASVTHPAGKKRARKLADLAPPSVAPRRPFIAKVATKAGPAPAPPGLERRERVGLSRGTLPIEARIDLHGLRQADAHAALIGFVLRARQAGHARVLVVTGKGSDEPFSERGVLRRAVPHWLRGGELRALVLGFEEAARHHGGAGALYVRLRRR